MAPIKPPDKWLNERIDELLPLSAQYPVAHPGSFRARTWSWLKLAVLDYYIPIYLKILQPKYTRLVFVDLFAGSGVSAYQHGSVAHCAPGSSLVAASYRTRATGSAAPGFHEIVAVELLDARRDSLRDVLASRGYAEGRDLHLLLGDANQRVDDVLRLLRRRGTHALLLADPEGLDLHYRTLERIVKSHPGTDLFLTHLAAGAARGAGDADSPKRDAMYGTPEWRQCRTRADFTNLYVEQLQKIRDIVIPISIKGDFDAPGYYYDFMFAVRETPGGSGWADSIERLRPKVESLDGEDVARVLRQRWKGKPSATKSRQRLIDEPSDQPPG